MRDDGVADVQFMDTGNGRDRLHVRVVQAVPGIDSDAPPNALFHGCFDAHELCLHLGGICGFGVAAGVQFDDGRAGGGSGFDLLRIRIDEQRYADAGVCQLLARRLNLGNCLLYTSPSPRDHG